MIHAARWLAASVAGFALPALAVPFAFNAVPFFVNTANVASYQTIGDCVAGSPIQMSFTVSPTTLSTSTSCGNDGRYTTPPLDLSGLPDGAITVIATMAVSGYGTSGLSFTVTKDTVAPTISLFDNGPIVPQNQGAYLVSGSCSEAGRQVSIEVVQNSVVAGPATKVLTSCRSGAFSTHVSLGALPKGTIKISALSSDQVGNTGATVTFAEKATGNRWRHSFSGSIDTVSGVDLAWRHPSGAHGYWFSPMNMPTVRTLAPLPAGEIVKFASLSGLYHSDVLWRSAGGDYYVAEAQVSADLGYTNSPVLLYPGGTQWEVIHAADFDGDGKDDLVWKHATGAYGLWLMAGATMRSAALLAPPAPGYQIALVADFDGDGKTDVLWTHPDGSARISLMDGAVATQAVQVLGPNTGWSPMLAGDFNADDKADILWRHADGSWGAWLLDGTTILKTELLRPANNGWNALMVRDLDGDGLGDILWESTDGQGAYEAWTMNGTSSTDRRLLLDGGFGWFVVGSGDYDSDGKDDLLWRSAAGEYGIWRMDGLTTFSTQSILPGGSGWEVVR